MNIICKKLLTANALSRFFEKPQCSFTVVNSQFEASYEHNNQLVLDIVNKKFRKMALDQSVLRKEKVVVPAEYRKATDSLVSLKKQLRSPGNKKAEVFSEC